MKRYTTLFILIIFATLLSACRAAAPAETEETVLPPTTVASRIITEGRLEPVQYADISFSASGIVDEVLVVEGAEIEEGEILARLENIDLLEMDLKNAEDELERAEAAILTEVADAYKALRVAQQILDEYSIPSEFDGMTPAEAAEAMLIKVNEARDDFEPYWGYDNPRGYIKDLEDAVEDAWADYNQALIWMNRETNVATAKIRLAQAQEDYANLLAGNDIAAQRNLSVAENALSNAQLWAPISGTVANLNIKVGERVNMGQASAIIADFSSWLVKTTDLTELDVVNIAEGQIATITLDAMPESPLTGTVLSIGQTFSESQGDVVYEVTIALDETNPAMRWGMTALVEFAE
ncbi:MAG: HlyD family efflux transporter periplasmic adaptor subunit [Anaerolineae bacterium]|mgnify:CR=1 FL=1|jgi:multidrug efflux pump subunit AcrA (membrane-fusion protein)|nr:HlyD family efflux transporter periplasmic adaptor subunit [Anaerolineae bacterium]MBT7188598.1 HlyD family efflux transporter periplasmic adaptor subunit [Anaerolineae bacterium]MBT7989959.1 HlyD family efflux transporter periplasmic adaptor subunit [Anaerolineae bacterium]